MVALTIVNPYAIAIVPVVVIVPPVSPVPAVMLVTVPPVGKVCHVAVVAEVAFSTCPVVGAAEAYMLTELFPELSHKPVAITLFVFPVSVLFVNVSAVF